MTSAFPDLVRRINKYHEHLSREQDTDLQHAYLSALIEAAQDLSAQGKTALEAMIQARDHGHVEGVIRSLGSIIDQPVTPAGTPSSWSARSLGNEWVDAFLENAAGRGEEKARDTGGGGLFVESETRELRESLPYVAKINLPVVSSQRGGLVEGSAARVAPAQETYEGGVDLDQVCPCTLQGHDCCYPGGCAMIKTCLKATKGEQCQCRRPHVLPSCPNYLNGKHCLWGAKCTYVHDRPGQNARRRKANEHSEHHKLLRPESSAVGVKRELKAADAFGLELLRGRSEDVERDGKRRRHS